ncbi:putative RNA-directed DNA polymerase [Aphis craccivora]|uniref:Putative RNA-directed DNA polymerase n=2 Tax=Aphis craccivora TaxID=307492 RepID=A0A6G0VSB7_APHCR|nr:putative RNA-directed DNA polymerase [Aphis craccivora]
MGHVRNHSTTFQNLILTSNFLKWGEKLKEYDVEGRIKCMKGKKGRSPTRRETLEDINDIDMEKTKYDVWFLKCSCTSLFFLTSTVPQNKRFFSRLANHNNPLISNLNNLTLPDNPRRRLKRRWCRGLLQ